MNTHGTFAKSLAVYLRSGAGSQGQSNAVVNVNLSNATVDSQSLGSSGSMAVNSSMYNPNGTTSVSECLTDNGGGTDMVTFTGPGFDDAIGITISPALTGLTTQRGW